MKETAKQPEALVLAEVISACGDLTPQEILDKAVAELRRLQGQNAELLNNLKRLVTSCEVGDINAPGHAHAVPGIWDDDNGALSGSSCEWCDAWTKARAIVARIEGGAT